MPDLPHDTFLTPPNGRQDYIPRNITPLSRPLSSRLRSSLVAPSYPQVLSELLQNSLDGGAKTITVWLDLTKGEECLRVEDDGCGIPVEQMKRLGKRGEISKPLNESGLASLGSYGFRGEALVSIAALGMLEITSKTTHGKSHTKIIKAGKTLFNGQSKRDRRGAKGTTIVVRELFHNVPVRQLALAATSTQSTLSACKKVIETLALARPSVSWIFWEEKAVGTSVGGSKRILSIPPGRSSIDIYRSIYGTAGVERVQNIRVTSGKKRIDGFISLEGILTKSHQHICQLDVNSYSLERGDLHNAVSKRFANSSFSLMASEMAWETDGSSGRLAIQSSKHLLTLGIVKRRSPRQLERHPVYVLNITLPASEVDAAYDPGKTIVGYKDPSTVKGFVLAVVDEYLRKHDLKTKPKPRDLPPTSPTKTVHTPHQAQSILPQKRVRSCETPISPSKPSFRDTEHWLQHTLAERATGVFRSTSRRIPPRHDGEDSGDDCFEHGCHSPPSLLMNGPRQLATISFPASRLATARVIAQIDGKFIACVIHPDPQKVDDRSLILIDQHAADERAAVEAVFRDLCDGFASNSITTTTLSKTDPKVVLSKEEGDVLVRDGVLPIFSRWGLQLEPPTDTATWHDYLQVAVKAVPATLLFRLGQQAAEMTRLVKLYLAFLEAHLAELQVFLQTIDRGDSLGWEAAMRWMPQEMVELVNSKACRGAIMFQDALDLDQCERLVHRLGQTRNPFQCAHGRPSLVPLVMLNSQGEHAKRHIDWSRWTPPSGPPKTATVRAASS